MHSAKRWPLAAASCVWGLVLTLPARAAEDFSGFYAGVNAGYAFQAGGRSGDPVTAPPRLSGGRAEDLPPSASRAAGHNPAMPKGRRGRAPDR
ncbi:hypothetical protein OPKNFCMD_0920 [Methylobacterium crusticola]|uniref:Porin family protein n=1 Tax=Methylobacterium crusticola TaxID=1697972 RepID=A0ABQ4QTD1_9HYPH|nr:hypothetical protein [Methylobacterium crusticola]GJD48204.1 hypothetical protein OPKNFCMD_0920 [Methylobacterium crusticola]